jgi:hypothetical protein
MPRKHAVSHRPNIPRQRLASCLRTGRALRSMPAETPSRSSPPVSKATSPFLDRRSVHSIVQARRSICSRLGRGNSLARRAHTLASSHCWCALRITLDNPNNEVALRPSHGGPRPPCNAPCAPRGRKTSARKPSRIARVRRLAVAEGISRRYAALKPQARDVCVGHRPRWRGY